MKIKFINGDLLSSKANIICHQTNNQGVMGGGVALAVKKKYPEVFNEYKKYCDEKRNHLGDVQFVCIGEKQYIANLFGQNLYPYSGDRCTSYDAVYDGLSKIRSVVEDESYKSIAFPYGMSSVRGGANWNIIIKMIEEVFSDLDIIIEIWKL